MSAEILTKQIENLNISFYEALKHDMEYIVWLYYKEIPILDHKILKIKKSTKTIKELYYDILQILDEKDEKKN